MSNNRTGEFDYNVGDPIYHHVLRAINENAERNMSPMDIIVALIRAIASVERTVEINNPLVEAKALRKQVSRWFLDVMHHEAPDREITS